MVDLRKICKYSGTKYIQWGMLLFIMLVEGLTALFGSELPEVTAQFMTMGINMAAAMFFGITVAQFPNHKTARKMLLTCGGFCLWIVVLQVYDFKGFSLLWPFIPRFRNSTLFCEYLMMLPLAAFLNEEKKDTGLWILCAAVMVTVLGHVLLTWELFRGKVPHSMADIMQWMGTRLSLMWHPNVLAGILLAGMGAALTACAAFKKIYFKIPALLFAGILFYMIILTNTRSVTSMACCVLGGIVFFLIYRNHWKSFLLGLMAALLVISVTFLASGKIYSAHAEWLIDQAIENQLPEQSDILQDPEDIEQSMRAEAGQASLKKNLPTFNGRTAIWKAAFEALKENPRIILPGTAGVAAVVSSCNRFEVGHAHNSWIQALIGLGLISFGFILYITWLAVKNAYLLFFVRASSLYQKIVGLLVLGIMGSQFFEAYIFYVSYPNNYLQMVFMLCLGYMIYWGDTLPDVKQP